MARIAGVNIPREKRVEIGLTYVYGIGRTTANEILEKVGISKDTYVRDLTEEEVGQLREVIERDYIVEGDLRRERAALEADVRALRARMLARPLDSLRAEAARLRRRMEHVTP